MHAVGCQAPAEVSIGDCYNERCHGVNGQGDRGRWRTTVSPMNDPEGPATPGPPPTVVRIACVALLVMGFGSVLISLPSLAKPESARCTLARARIDDANTDRKPWNNVETGGRKARDI